MEDGRDVLHVHAVWLHSLLEPGCASSARQLVQERRARIDGVDQRVQFRGQHQRLTAGAATGIDDDIEFSLRQQP